VQGTERAMGARVILEQSDVKRSAQSKLRRLRGVGAARRNPERSRGGLAPYRLSNRNAPQRILSPEFLSI
jgi:hypothetical protein